MNCIIKIINYQLFPESMKQKWTASENDKIKFQRSDDTTGTWKCSLMFCPLSYFIMVLSYIHQIKEVRYFKTTESIHYFYCL